MAKPSSNTVTISGDAIKIGDFVCSVLHSVYVENRAAMQAMADQQGVPFESIAAAALTQGLVSTFGGK